MGYQFIHLESYCRKADAKGRSTDFIFLEASRKPEASVHVENPLPPVVVFGIGVEALQKMHDDAAATATIVVKGGHIRKVAKDKKTLHTVIASHPFSMNEIRTDPMKRAEAEKWERRTIAWLQKQYGQDLKSVIRHEDEEYFHVHAYVLPLTERGMSALRYHPGTTAKREVMAAGPADGEESKALSKLADAAYKRAMRAWQDDYHEGVAVPCGLTRLGPQRRRLTRDEWQREQVQAKALQQTVERAQRVKNSGEAFIEKTKSEAAAIRADASQEREAAAQAANAAMAAEKRAQKAQDDAQEVVSQAKRYSGIAGRIRALWDALGESRLAERIREDFAAEITRLHAFAKTIQERLRTEEKRRTDAERQARDALRDAEQARNEATRMMLERDQALALLPRDTRLRISPGALHSVTFRPKPEMPST